MATIGNADFSGGFAGYSADFKAVCRYTATLTAPLTNPRIYLRGGAGPSTVRFIVYTDGPGTLLAQSTNAVVTAGAAAAWVTFTFATPPTLVNGTAYTIGLHVSAIVDVGYKNTSGFTRWYTGVDPFSDGTESGWGGGGTTTGVEQAVIGDLLPVAAFVPQITIL